MKFLIFCILGCILVPALAMGSPKSTCGLCTSDGKGINTGCACFDANGGNPFSARIIVGGQDAMDPHCVCNAHEYNNLYSAENWWYFKIDNGGVDDKALEYLNEADDLWRTSANRCQPSNPCSGDKIKGTNILWPGGAGDVKAPANRRRRLAGAVNGPCSGFSMPKNGVCPSTPTFNPDMTKKDGLSYFANEWIEYSCCKVMTEEKRGLIATVWLWQQVCTNTVHLITDMALSRDKEYKAQINGTINALPLHQMKMFCPSNLEGGELSETLVSAFFPVLEDKNPHYEALADSANQCKKEENAGAVSLLFTKAESGTFGHVAMVVHSDKNLVLPADLDSEHYMSFTTQSNTIGPIITGSKSKHEGFGTNFNGVTEVVTLHNANVPAMLRKWKEFKKSGQMYDLLEWNCARVVMMMFQEGFKGCKVPLDHHLWTPSQAMDYIKQAKTKVSDGSSASTTLSLQAVHARHIEHTVTIKQDSTPVIVAGTTSFFGALIVATVVAGIVVWKVKADALKQLESANMQLEAGIAHVLLDVSNGLSAPNQDKSGVAPPEMNFEEFSKWAKERKLTEEQVKIMWKNLDTDNDDNVSKEEWNNFIDNRPHLKFIVNRLESRRC